MSEIQKTSDYSVLKKHPSNRDLIPCNVKKVIASISANNLLEFRPILVDSEMRVLDGQHRLEAAKALKLPIYYQIDVKATHENIALINDCQQRWDLTNWMDYHISLGNVEYLKLKEFLKETGYSLFFVTRKSGSLTTGRGSAEFKAGKFIFMNDTEKQNLIEIKEKSTLIKDHIRKYKLTDVSFIDKSKFQTGLHKILQNEALDFSTFLDKLMVKSESIKPCADSAAYYNMLKDIYNYRNKDPLD